MACAYLYHWKPALIPGRQDPQNKLQQIICDADLDYLGRDDFHQISDTLRRELRDHGKINSDRLWDELQIKFLEAHQYFTKSAIKLRQEKKLKHIEEIKQRLKENNYKDWWNFFPLNKKFYPNDSYLYRIVFYFCKKYYICTH